MAKRFTDTQKYHKTFIRGLQGAYKLLWDFLYCECDHAGIWIVDFEIAQILLGKDMPIDKENALKYFNEKEQKVVEIDSGKKWFIPSFIEFQYGELNPENRAHKSVILILKKYNLYNDKKGLTSPLQGYKDKDMDMDKDKVKDKDKDKDREKEKNPLHTKLKIQFLEFYEKKKNLPYSWSGIDGKHLNEIIKKIKFVGKTEDSQQISDTWIIILEKNQDKWINDNLSVSLINSKFNEIVAKIKKQDNSDLKSYAQQLIKEMTNEQIS
jgi:hypothetical protein